MMGRRRALMSATSGGSPYQHGTWDDLFWQIDNKSYKAAYSVGEILPLDLGSQGAVYAQIAAFDADELADGSGKYAPVTLISKHVLKSAHRMNPQLAGESGSRTEGTGAIGGWEKSEMRTYLINTVKPLIPTAIMDRIKTVKKFTGIYNTNETAINNVVTSDNVWIPSHREVFAERESAGPFYSDLFGTANPRVQSELRKKTKTNGETAAAWWLRTAENTQKFRITATNGSSSSYNAQYANYFIAIGFCVG